MRPLTDIFTTEDYPALLVGLKSPDDAAVYRLNDKQCVISTTDFFPPVVDDPYAFGAVAAANALSDVYAVGGTPLMAINLVAYPDGYGLEILTEILRGGAEKVREAGAVIAGGHTVTDKEPKYGLAVTGQVAPDQIMTKGGALPGDRLILTKPLGTGVITTALKNQAADEAHVDTAVASMMRLNREASRLAVRMQAHAMTDVTGFGLLGHAHEMAHLSSVDFVLHHNALPWLPGAVQYGEGRFFAGGMMNNRIHLEPWVVFDPQLSEVEQDLLFDPQTSGGLLIAVAPEQAERLQAALDAVGDTAAIIGEVIPGAGYLSVVA